MKNLSISLLAILVLGGGTYFLYMQFFPSQSGTFFATREECETVTRKSCNAPACDFIPPEKSLEEACGKGFRKGWWTPIEEQKIIGKSETISPAILLDTTDWKTYTNQKYGYQVKYPSEMKVGNYQEEGFWPAGPEEYIVGMYLEYNGKSGLGSVTIIASDDSRTYYRSDGSQSSYNKDTEGCMNLKLAIDKAKCLFPTTPVEKYNPQDITFAGVPALVWESDLSNTLRQADQKTTISLRYDGVQFQVEGLYQESNKNIINTVMKSFRFIK